MSSYSMTELIGRKRDGGSLESDELRWIITEYTADNIPHYQMSSLLMAILLVGMDTAELSAWTTAMLHSGDVLDLSAVPGKKVDKHSTGGVGDKVSIPLTAMVAACGVVVPMISGRGLGHTGGTLDKLESIPGFRTEVEPVDFTRQLDEIGLVLAGQSDTLVPADRRIYALRDATGTVPSIPLIASSIMSKKLAEDLDGLVLDVKVGSGAFMKDIETARTLAETMVLIGASHQTKVVAFLTDMSQPLGDEVGHSNEIAESISVLRGEGPDDLVELVYRLGSEMLLLAGVENEAAAARQRLEQAVATGAALDRFRMVVAAQGGNEAVVDDPGILPVASRTHVLEADSAGYVTACDALAVARAAMRLGAGRERKGDEVDHRVSITLHAKRGASVASGEPLATIRYENETLLSAALDVLTPAWSVSDEPPPPQPQILDEVRMLG
jgi:pyrimidine-nucleoside phosphorylase